MVDDHDKPGSVAAPEKPPKIKANDNPWYLLATLYGEPADEPDEDLHTKLKERNRVAWNCYYSAALDQVTRARLIDEKRHPKAELTPFSTEDLDEIAEHFKVRCNSVGVAPVMPEVSATIDFENVEFEQEALFRGYLFAQRVFFLNASFSQNATLATATFIRDAIFADAIFSGLADFTNATFAGWAIFNSAKFSRWAVLTSVAVRGTAEFVSAEFSQGASFKSATLGGANFASATFSGAAEFDRATFSQGVNFNRATFVSKVGFVSATFSGGAGFGSAAFSGTADFTRATFSGAAEFISATFSQGAGFNRATFSEKVHFASATFEAKNSFVNVVMDGETSFEHATFKTDPPEFFGAKLHEGTVWPDYKTWPVPKASDAAKEFVRAYERLKLEMDRLKKHEDELNFFALELRSRRVALGPRKGLPIAIYGVFSDYGRSYTRPLGWLCLVVVAGAIPLLICFDLTLKQPLASSLGQSLGLSLANTLNVFGFRKDFIDASLVEHLPWWLKVLAGLQTILGGVLLFLFGLGIRNRFRMK